MFKMKITGLDLIVEIISGNKKEKIEIKNGYFKDKVYFFLVFTEGKLILEGDNLIVLASKADAIVLDIKTSVEKLAEYFKNPNILIEGINVIPEEKLKEALQVITL